MISPANLDIPILGQLVQVQLPLVDAFQPGSLELLRSDAPLGPLRDQASEHAPRDPDHAVVPADLDPELHGLPLGIPAASSGWRNPR